jgi:hypothetical protein
VYTHINPQQPCVVSANGGWAADFIGRVEHLDEDLAAVLAELEKRRPAAAPPVSLVASNAVWCGGCVHVQLKCQVKQCTIGLAVV